MNYRLYFVSLFLSAIFGGIIALSLHQLLSYTPEQYESIEQRQMMHLTSGSYQWNSKVPEGLNFVNAAQVVRPAVVYIKTTYTRQTSRNSIQSDPLDEMFKQFQGDYHRYYPKQSSGSGVIITDNGYIVTNKHVIDQAGSIEVILNDKRSYLARLIGTDPNTDLALLKIKAENLPFAKYGNSEILQIGEWVLAIGNPFDLTSTVTAGIVSAKGRNINLFKDNNYAIESFIQTDAAINPGNSGGALVNLKGELIGINTAIATQTGYYAGYSFAIPVSIVKKVLDDLIKYGETQRALLGVSIIDIDSKMIREKNLQGAQGVYVASVQEKGAARFAGLKEGDIIESINGMNINSSAELQSTIALHRPGDKVKVIYKRKNTKYTTVITLRDKSGNINFLAKNENIWVFGAVLEQISLQDKQKLGIGKGVKVAILGEGKIKEAGIREGFIITSIDGKAVDQPEEIRKIALKKETTLSISGYYPDGSRAYYAIGTE